MLIAILPATGCPFAGADSAAGRVPDIERYVSAMRQNLADAGIMVRRIDSLRRELLVEYALSSADVSPEFALGAVLTLARPIADDVEAIRARHMADGKKLLELSVPPAQVDSVLASSVGEDARARIDALLAETLAAWRRVRRRLSSSRGMFRSRRRT